MSAMEPARQPIAHTSPTSMSMDVARGLAAVREREWPGVRITGVAMLANAPGAPERHRSVRAYVRLGGLTPADVRVHLTTVTQSADMAPADSWTCRLTSALAYHDGHFVFEGHVPEQMLATRSPLLAVVVKPSASAGEWTPRLTPVKRRLV